MLRVRCPRHGDDCVRGALHARPGGTFLPDFFKNIFFHLYFPSGGDEVPHGGVTAAALAGCYHDHKDDEGIL